MRLGFDEALAGSRRRTATCPGCGSPRARHSRRRYEGLWPRLLGVRPAKCFACGSYYPISAKTSIARSPTDPADLHIPFTPLEREELERPLAVDFSFSADRRWWLSSRGGCPGCGSRSVRPAHAPGGEVSLVHRLDLKDSYRCIDCNAGFFRLNLVRSLALALLLAVVLGGLGYALVRAVGLRRHSDTSPRIKQGQIPQPPPPVFR